MFNPFPKYLQLRDILCRRLRGEFKPGDRFPTEHALCAEFAVSRQTVRQALGGLERDGLITRQRGGGTFVVRHPKSVPEPRLTGLVEGFTELKRNTETRVLETGIIRPAAEIASAMKVPDGESVYRIRRLRWLDNEPFAHHEAFLPIEIGVQLARLDLRNTTLFSELRETLRIPIVEDYQHIDAVAADPEVAALLEVPVGAPLLRVRRAVLTNGTLPTMIFETGFRSDRYYYTVQVNEPHHRDAFTSPKDKTRRSQRQAPAAPDTTQTQGGDEAEPDPASTPIREYTVTRQNDG